MSDNKAKQVANKVLFFPLKMVLNHPDIITSLLIWFCILYFACRLIWKVMN
jgi:hypothetical protein